MQLTRRKLRKILNEVTEAILAESTDDQEENAAYALRLFLNRKKNKEAKELYNKMFGRNGYMPAKIKRKGRGDNAYYIVTFKGKPPITVGSLEDAEETMTIAASRRGQPEPDNQDGMLASTEDQEERTSTRSSTQDDANDELADAGSDLTDDMKPQGGGIYLVRDPLTGEQKRMRGTEDEIKTWMAKQSMKADAQRRDSDQYDQMRSDDQENPDPLRDRTSNYGGLSFDKFFKDILDGKKVIKYGTKAKAGSLTFKQIAAMQSLYNDISFSGFQKKYDKIDVDGKFGKQTREAIKDIQRASKGRAGEFKNTTVDGIVGRQTIALFDPSKSPLPITGANIDDATHAADNLSEGVDTRRWQLLAGV